MTEEQLGNFCASDGVEGGVEAASASREQTLITECLGGRLDAFGDLVAPYQDRLHNVLYRMFGRREEAAEVLQDGLIRAYRGLRQYQGGSTFYTWLYRIVVNSAISSQRKSRLRTVSANDGGDGRPLDLADDDPSSRPEHHLEELERSELIQDALGQVAEVFRAVLVLKEIDGLKYEEIGEILGIPVGTVRSRLHRARAELRERLRPLMEKGLL